MLARLVILFCIFFHSLFAQEFTRGIAPATHNLGDFFIKFQTSDENQDYVKIFQCSIHNFNQCKNFGQNKFYKLSDFDSYIKRTNKSYSYLSMFIDLGLELSFWGGAYQCSNLLLKRKFSNSWLYREQKEYGFWIFKTSKNGIVRWVTIGTSIGFLTSFIYEEVKELTGVSDLMDSQKFTKRVIERTLLPFDKRNQNNIPEPWIMREHEEPKGMDQISKTIKEIINIGSWKENSKLGNHYYIY